MDTLLSRSRHTGFSLSTPALYLLFGVLFVCALWLRATLYPIVTGDYTTFLSPWYDFIHSHGGFAALKYDFANYNPPYLYLLAIATYLPIPKLVAIKSISVGFDLLLALFAYLILRLKYRNSYMPMVGATAILFTPTIFINSSAWGQCDAIYTAFCLGSLYALLTKRPLWACLFFGLAISFKLQAIFFLPVLLLAVLKREVRWPYLVTIPLVWLILLAPAYVAGRDLGSLFMVYVEQISTGGVGGAQRVPAVPAASTSQGGALLLGRVNRQPTSHPATGAAPHLNTPNSNTSKVNRFGTNRLGTSTANTSKAGTNKLNINKAKSGLASGIRRGNGFSSLTYNAPSIYQWLSGTPLARNKWVGIVLAALAVALLGLLLLINKSPLTPDILMHISLVCAVAIPFFLPEMHERYFFLADVIAILYAFYFPRFFYMPILMQIISLLSYAPFLLHSTVISLWYVAFAVLSVMIIAWVQFAKALPRTNTQPAR
jgi:Gpi18-like mannosyltransferase